MSPIYLTKSITASSSITLGSYSTATTTAYTSGATVSIAAGTQLDSARRIIVWSSAAASDGLSITLTGLSEGGFPITETIVGSSAAGSTKQTTQDFLSVTSVSFSSQNPLGAKINIGTNTQAGTPWKMLDQNIESFNLALALTFNSTISTTLANFEVTLDDPTQTIKPLPVRFLSTNTTLQVPFTPIAFIPQTAGSTTLSTANASQTTPAYGNLTSPVTAWRLTLTSSSSTAGAVTATAIQLGV